MDEHRGLRIPEDLADALEPDRLALLVYDMQVGVLAQVADADRVATQVRRVLDAARAARVRTVFLRHTSMPVELMGVFQLRQAKVWQRRDRAADAISLFPPHAPGTQITPLLTPEPGEAVIDKITMSAFEGTPLDMVLRDCGVVAFLVVGVALEVGIDPTVRHAADLGYVPIVVRDACGWGDEEAARRSLEGVAFAGDAIIAEVEEVVALLSPSSGKR